MSGEEYLDVLDADGNRIDTKTRQAVHHDGDWHALVFVWAAYRDAAGQVRLLLQVRARPGDPFAGNVDAPAGGHVAAGETHRQGGVREFGEEVGVAVDGEDLVFLGCRRLENPTGPCRRVWQYFYLYPQWLGLDEVEFNEEVSGFVDVGLDDVAAVLEGEMEYAAGVGRLVDAPEEEVPLRVTAASLASYGPAILDVFRRSMRAVRGYMEEGVVDEAVWDG